MLRSLLLITVIFIAVFLTVVVLADEPTSSAVPVTYQVEMR